MSRLPSLCSASFPPLLPRHSGPDLSHPFSRPPIRSLSCASLFPAVCWSVVVYQKHLLFSFPKSPHTRDNTHAHRCINIYIYTVYVYMNTKQANLWDAEARTRTCTLSGGAAGHVCVCACVRLRVADAVFQKKKKKKRKSTSLPRELSAIADLNPHRYLSAASSFWTAVAAVKAGTYFFCFSGTNPGASAERSRAIWMHTVQGFYRNGTQAGSPCQHSLTSESCFRNGGGAYIWS